MYIQKHSNDFKIEKNFKNKVRALSNKKSFQKIRVLSNKRLPNKQKSDMKTYQTLRSATKEETWEKTPSDSSA